MRTVKLWQACALVAELDPDEWLAPLGDFYIPDIFPEPAATKHFEKILRLAKSAVNSTEGPIFPRSDSQAVDKQNLDVLLPEVVTFLMGCSAGIGIPEQLRDLQLVAPAGAAKEAGVDASRPQPLTTGDVAFCFASLKWSEAEWKEKLGKKPKWLASALQSPGQQGKSPRLWNPVQIGAALVHQGYASQKSVRARFQAEQYARFLRPWLDEWKTYEADYLSTD